MKSRAEIEQIHDLYNNRYPIKKIVEILQVSRNTVRRYLRMPPPAKDSDQTKSAKSFSWKLAIDWDEICLKRRQGYSVHKLFDDYCRASPKSGNNHYIIAAS